MIQADTDPFGLRGAILAGKYDVLEPVEETAFSVVYRARHRIWRRPVAIKAFKAPMLADDARGQLLDGFVREGALLMELSERCAAICQAHDIGSTTTLRGEWLPYMVLEWLEGESLEARLLRERAAGVSPRSLGEAIALLEPVARALSVAHDRGIAHRDLKPGNILLLSEHSRDGADGPSDAARCKLLDFGVAKVLGDAHAEGEGLLGQSFTPEYGAPEQFDPRFGPTGPWTDVYALALVLVELMVGHEPLVGRTTSELRARACDPHRRPSPRAFGVSLPEEAHRVIARALAVDHRQRFSHAGPFWSELTRAAREPRPLTSRESSVTMAIPLLRKRARRRWLRPAVIAAAVCVVLLAVDWRAVAPSIDRAQAWSRASAAAAHLMRARWEARLRP
jgi:serine/threonine protein kinase